MAYLGIDIGTSGVKAVIIDDTGKVAAQATEPLSLQRPAPLHAEQDPDDWWAATERSVLGLPSDLRRKVRAIGLSGQMHGAVFLDRDGHPLRPAILWNDGRSAVACEALETAEPRSRTITGNLAMPGFTAPKALWVAEHEPSVFEKTKKVLLPKDYIRLKMSGDYATDMSDASGTLWLDVAQRRWSERMLAATSLPSSAMPDCFEGAEPTGVLRARVAERWGLDAVTIVAGGGDNAAGALGVGVLDDGDAFLSLGTSGVLFVAGRDFRPNPERGVHAFCHAVAGRWHEMSVMLSAAACLEWAAGLTQSASVEALIARAANATADSVPVFLPYLSGERTPHNDPYARGVLFGMDHATGPEEVSQAVLEGVAFGLADGLATMQSAEAIASITVIGGGSRSHAWGRILSAALGKPLVYRRDGDVGPALGAAKLARFGLGEATETEVFAPPAITAEIEPDNVLRERLSPKLHRYRELYERTQALFQPRT